MIIRKGHPSPAEAYVNPILATTSIMFSVKWTLQQVPSYYACVVPLSSLFQKTMPLCVVSAIFCGVNTPIMADFNLTTDVTQQS